MKVMEYVDRYVYVVTQKLPEKQRADIEKELRGLIEDMLEERAQGEVATQGHVEEVLMELGDPSVLADQYRGYKRFLISPEMFSLYWMVLKIVLISIGIGMTVVFAIESIISPMNVLDHFIGYIVSIINSLVQGFAWVTFSFAIVEYSGVNSRKLGLDARIKSWSPSMLLAIPDPNTQIKKSDPIASIIFNILFLVVLISSIDLLAFYLKGDSDGFARVPFLDAEVFHSYLPLIFIMLALVILTDILKLVIGRWTVKLAAVCIGVNVAGFILALIVFNDAAIWNANFMSELSRLIELGEGDDFLRIVGLIWEANKTIILAVIGLVTLIESILIIVKVNRARGIR
jgi:hypothetical protein